MSHCDTTTRHILLHSTSTDTFLLLHAHTFATSLTVELPSQHLSTPTPHATRNNGRPQASSLRLPVHGWRRRRRVRDPGHVPSGCRQDSRVSLTTTRQSPESARALFLGGLLARDTANQLTRCEHSQIQSHVPVPGVDHYSGMLDCIKKIVKNEGYGYSATCHQLEHTRHRTDSSSEPRASTAVSQLPSSWRLPSAPPSSLPTTSGASSTGTCSASPR